MKKRILRKNLLQLLSISFFALFFSIDAAQAKDIQKDSVKVSGKCGMCQKRIISAAIGKGVRNVQWDKNTKMLSVIYDADKTSMSEIEQRISKVGHDTENYKSDVASYENLHSCCKYPREK